MENEIRPTTCKNIFQDGRTKPDQDRCTQTWIQLINTLEKRGQTAPGEQA